LPEHKGDYKRYGPKTSESRKRLFSVILVFIWNDGNWWMSLYDQWVFFCFYIPACFSHLERLVNSFIQIPGWVM